MSSHSNLLITGGTGTIGKSFCKHALNSKRYQYITIYSRNEYKQWQMKQEIQEEFGIKAKRVKFIIGDVRDFEHLNSCVRNTEYILHAAALKHVSVCNDNIQEAIKTNIIGTQNIINACNRKSVNHVVLMSTDKAVHPINVYAYTKALAEEFFMRADVKKFSIVRGGNLVGSSGSVLEIYLNLIKKGETKLPVTDARCTRYWMSEQSINEIIFNALHTITKKVLVPEDMPSFRIIDLVRALGCTYYETGLGVGEKLHEQLDDTTNSEHVTLLVDDIKRLLKHASFYPLSNGKQTNPQ